MFRREADMFYAAINSQALGFAPGVCLSRTSED